MHPLYFVKETSMAYEQPGYEEKAGTGKVGGTRDDAKATPSGSTGDNAGTAGSGETKVDSSTPDNAMGKLNPSAPGETGTTPGTNGEQK